MGYSRLFGSQFPNSTITLGNYKDVGEADSETQELIKQFQIYMDNGDIASATEILESNWDLLKPFYVGMNTLNKMEEEIYNVGLFALKSQTAIVSDAEPTIEQQLYASWIKPIDSVE